MASLFAGEPEIGVRLVAVISDPMTNVLPSVGLFRIELVQKRLRQVRLLDLLLARRQSHLLISKLPNGRAQVVGVHRSPPTWLERP